MSNVLSFSPPFANDVVERRSEKKRIFDVSGDGKKP